MGDRKVDPLERQMSLLLYLLTEGGPRTREQIVEKVPGYPPDLESMRRQFERDKDALKQNDIPLRATENEDGHFYEIRESEYYLQDLKLTRDETIALELALSAVKVGGSSSTDVMRKVGASADPRRGALTTATLPAEDLLPALFAARRVRAAVSLSYKGEERNLDPYAVFFTNGYWYVAGFDHARGEQRTFRVDRIEGEVTAGRHGSFVVPDSFRAADVLPAPWQLPGDEPVTAEVRITDPYLAAFVVESMGELAEVTTESDGSSVVRFEVRNRGAFRSWLFGMLDDAEVLGPDSLRADTIEWLRGMAK